MSIHRAVLIALACMVTIGPASADGAEFAWVPVDATGPYTVYEDPVEGTIEIILDGVAARECFGGSDPGAACVTDSDCPGACAGGSNPGDPCYGNEDCFDGGTCSNPLPGTCTYGVTVQLRLWDWGSAIGNPSLGTYQATVDSAGYSAGLGDPLFPLNWPGTDEELGIGAFIDTTHSAPPYVFSGFTSLPAVARSTLDYEYGSVVFGGGKVDDGQTYYGGTLTLEIPAQARGTYPIEFVIAPTKTFMRDSTGLAITPINTTPGLITVACVVDEDCDDGNDCTDDVCEIDGRCTNSLSPPGTECGGPPSGDCDAQDECDGAGTCVDLLEDNSTVCRIKFGPCDVAEYCTGSSKDCPPDEVEPPGVPCPDEGNDCTDDECDGVVKQCTHPPKPSGTACGSQDNTECTNPDTCDGEGNCDPNDAPPTTPCGNPDDTDCTDPDTCDGFGECNPNHEPNGTPCDDGLFCTIDEECVDGECTGGAFTCDDEVGCTDDTCDEDLDTCFNEPNDANCNNGQWCDGEEICDPVEDCIVSPGSVPDCDDQVGCTDDSCDEFNDQCVNTPNDFYCDNGQWCDGFESCDPLEDCQPGTAPDCDDQIDCTEDWCDETADTCVHTPNDDLCPDDGLFCNGEEICVAGVGCDHTGNPCSGPCDEENDSCLCDTPIAEQAGARYLAVSLQPPDAGAQAIVVKPACSAGVPRYVGIVEEFEIKGWSEPPVLRGILVDDPTEAVFLTPAEWGDPVYVTGVPVTAATTFEVWADCGWPGSPAFSESTTVMTRKLGDVEHNDVVNFGDVQWQIFAFMGQYFVPGTDLTLANVDMTGDPDCLPNGIVNFVDIVWTIKVFQGRPYDEFCWTPPECPPCFPPDCDDDNACTDEGCDIETGDCWYILNYDEATECCDPETGETTLIGDGDPCTIDECDPETGQVTHVPMDCTDSDDCTLDECVDGVCIHTHFESIPCEDNFDCPPESPGCAGSHCTCPGTPAPFMEWRPVSSSGPYTIDGAEITIPAGGVQVEFQVWLDEWDPYGIRAFQFTVDGENSYVSGEAGSLSPLTDPDPDAGAYIDATWAYYLFKFLPSIEATNLMSLNYMWGAARLTSGPGVPYTYQDKYLGTLILEVSPDAAGTFTLDFDPDIAKTLLLAPEGVRIPLLTLKAGYLTVSGE